jgi:hypothetical protein
MADINYAAVLAASVANFVLGGIWYQLLFRKPVYREIAGRVTPRDLSIAFVRGLVMAWALAVLMTRTGVHSWPGAIGLAALVWFGFMATAQLSETLFGGRSWRIYLINTGYPLGILLIAGTILSLWT